MPSLNKSPRTYLKRSFSFHCQFHFLPNHLFLCPTRQTIVSPHFFKECTHPQLTTKTGSNRLQQRHIGRFSNHVCNFSEDLQGHVIRTSLTTPSLQAPAASASVTSLPGKNLPNQCPGCGAFSQTSYPGRPGFFNLGRQKLKEHLGQFEKTVRVREEDYVVQETLQNVDLVALASQSVDLSGLIREHIERPALGDSQPILCERCHTLVHHNSGAPIFHPDISALRETISESPYKYNHVYHILDAADFPMSLLPRIRDLLDYIPLRSRNRRSRQETFRGGRIIELSFVIARSDLLAPRKAQVDKLMPWFRETLRDALGKLGSTVRLGNIYCVSARRNWWTSNLKDDIWKRGGATWLVGKANVGKSCLANHVFPKGRMGECVSGKSLPPTVKHSASTFHNTNRGYDHTTKAEEGFDLQVANTRLDANHSDGILLPPRPQETNYPQMPVVSALPGTTASPIRIPFGNGRGELIDLPGLERSGLANYVDTRYLKDLVMMSRIQPEQTVLKGPSQSLLLGGCIRITPKTPNLVFLAYNFTPLHTHRTMTEKAITIQKQSSDLNVKNISAPGTGDTISSAGSFELRYDVTKARTGPIMSKDAANIRLDRLPYRVMALDLLIEGCGWVEIVAQVRTKDLFPPETAQVETEGDANTADSAGAADFTPIGRQNLSEPEKPFHKWAGSGDELASIKNNEDINWPAVEVFSPCGKFVGSRRPLNAWLLCQPKKSKTGAGSRPKRSMKGYKRQRKVELSEGPAL